MTIKRLLVVALLAALTLRLLPVIGPILWPGWRRSLAEVRRRADLATAVVMLAVVGSMLARRELVWAAVVAVLSIPALVAGVRAVRRPS
ncbi:MAG: hypothetical protein HYV09_31825 [Deltaproteobacteria bacterium]|nr:hypothetical protein [Deltaproteobacteria bacterium]